MRIDVTRIEGRRYGTVVERADGVSLSVPGYGFMYALPHDLAHYVVEATLRLPQGFWGSVADGVVFDGMAVLSGRRRPGAEARSKELRKANARHLDEAEGLVAYFVRVVDGNLDRSWPLAEAELRSATSHLGAQARRITPEEGAAVCTAWRAMQARWDGLAAGGALRLEWPERQGTRRRR